MKTVVVRSFDNYFSASIILTRLQDAGITAFLKDEHSATVYPILSNAIGGIKLEVNAKDAAEANRLLLQFHDEYMHAAVCPRCAKNQIEAVPAPQPTNMLIRFLKKIFPKETVSTERIYRCRHCGYESVSLPENTIEHN